MRRLREIPSTFEDNEDTAETLKEVLELEGHKVQVEQDEVHGLEAAHRFRPDAVLCDIGLPGMNGYEVARRLRTSGGIPATWWRSQATPRRTT